METNKHLTDHSSNEMIRQAIQKIAWKGVIDRNTGAIRGTSKVTGYVALIHDDEEDELFGTIDVQEYVDFDVEMDEGVRLGYHEGVLLTAIQNDREGYVIIPKLYSEVLVAQDPSTGQEYVTMFSHVDLIQLDSHEQISVRVREREPYTPEDDEAPDIHELSLTGNQAVTTYLSDSMVTEVDVKQGNNTVKATQVIGKSENGVIVKYDVNGKSTSTMTTDSIVVDHDGKATLTLDNDQSKLETGNSKVKVTNGVVYLGDDNSEGVDDAVLGKELASILSELVGYLGQMMTSTLMGPQPPANVLGSFISLKAKIEAFKSSNSGFLTSKVKVQK